jgi:Cu-processing system permease protein
MLNIKGQAAVGVAAAPDYMLLASLYGLLYAGVLVTGACLVFQRRDF